VRGKVEGGKGREALEVGGVGKGGYEVSGRWEGGGKGEMWVVGRGGT